MWKVLVLRVLSSCLVLFEKTNSVEATSQFKGKILVFFFC